MYVYLVCAVLDLPRHFVHLSLDTLREAVVAHDRHFQLEVCMRRANVHVHLETLGRVAQNGAVHCVIVEHGPLDTCPFRDGVPALVGDLTANKGKRTRHSSSYCVRHGKPGAHAQNSVARTTRVLRT